MVYQQTFITLRTARNIAVNRRTAQELEDEPQRSPDTDGDLVVAGTHPSAVVTAVALLSLSLSGMITALTSRVLRIAPGNADVASAAGSAAFQGGLAVGSFLGGRLLDAHGPHSTVVTGVFLAAAGLVLFLVEEPLSHRGGSSHGANRSPVTDSSDELAR
ncbi:hypothetical protein ACWD4J_28440 [Streptomyces sp. NPDC002577]